MLCDSSGQDVVNSFSLVAYIPDPLRKFLDDLRRELVPGCVPNAHVTILPPRPPFRHPGGCHRNHPLAAAGFPAF